MALCQNSRRRAALKSDARSIELNLFGQICPFQFANELAVVSCFLSMIYIDAVVCSNKCNSCTAHARFPSLQGCCPAGLRFVVLVSGHARLIYLVLSIILIS